MILYQDQETGELYNGERRMKTYRITTCTVIYETYEVEAETPERAEDYIFDGGFDPISEHVSECDVIENKEITQ